jgi:hypothetical protein
LFKTDFYIPAFVTAVHDFTAGVAWQRGLHGLEAVRAVGGEVLGQDVRHARTLYTDDVADGNVARGNGIATSTWLVSEKIVFLSISISQPFLVHNTNTWLMDNQAAPLIVFY